MTTTKPSFVYTIYIASTPEKVWDALLDPEMTKRYWGRMKNVSDWAPGSRWEHQLYDPPNTPLIVGKVVESDRPRRLVLTWADPDQADDPEKVSRVTFTIATSGENVKLTMEHEELEPGSKMLRGITQGWPPILSSLKSLLETGRPLPGTDRRWDG